MDKTDRFTADAEAWDSGELGRDEDHVKRANIQSESALDSALGLHPISIRLQQGLIDDLKFIGIAHGIGYQPLIRDILMRFVVHEKKQILRDVIERQRLELQQKELAIQSEQKPKSKAA